jgi:hypothetical protein
MRRQDDATGNVLISFRQLNERGATALLKPRT